MESDTAMLHKSMRLTVTSEKFYIEPTPPDLSSTEILVIDRVSQEITLKPNKDEMIKEEPSTSTDIFGIVGIARLLAGPYLIVITKRIPVGEIDGNVIYKVGKTEMFPYVKSTFHLTDQQVYENKTYLGMIEHVLSMESFYFSVSYDLTHSMQRLHNTSPDFKQMHYYERADPRFVWNGHLLRELIQQQELGKYCLPLMLGFVSINHCNIQDKPFNYILISRRSCFRAGTRYYMRGVDSEGHAANFVETEQILEFEGNKCSQVQTRGSVPLYWEQRPNLKYKPDPRLHETNHLDGFQKHFAAQIYNYGHHVLINLLDQKGKEDMLVKAYEKTVVDSMNKQIKYEGFDFHHECRKMRWDRLSILMDRIGEDIKKFGFFMVTKDSQIRTLQEGVFRTNCIDCLDRTNVVQGMVARKNLLMQFLELEILQKGQTVEEQTHFEHTFKNVWADNADACAKQYAGTGALKTDFTRTGSRTKWGLVRDGYNSALRYVKNNFSDGHRQDSIDLFLGNYIIEGADEGVTRPSPLRVERDWKFYALPVIFFVAFSMCVISVLIPDENPKEQLLYVLFWGGASSVTMGLMYHFGIEFVDQPKLTQSKTKTD